MEAIAMTDRNENYLSPFTLTTIAQLDQGSAFVESPAVPEGGCSHYFHQWWECQTRHQQFIVHTVEKTAFHIGVIILVLIDCVLVVGELLLDFILLNQKCGSKDHTRASDDEKTNPGLELAIEILHFGSIVLLAIFVLEVLIKIYAFAHQWWNFREKKMEWLDAVIVIVSFTVDIYFLEKPNVIGEISLLFISFRLWRIIRIINSVAQSIRSQDETAKKGLAETYSQIVELMLTVSTKKTEVAAQLADNFTRENLNQMLEKFTSIDNSCRSTLESCPKPSSRNAVTDLAQHLQTVLEQMRLTSSKLSAKS